MDDENRVSTGQNRTASRRLNRTDKTAMAFTAAYDCVSDFDFAVCSFIFFSAARRPVMK